MNVNFAALEKFWFPVRVRGRFEKKIAEKLLEREIEYYLPIRKERHRWSDRWKTVESILFPGYLFVYIRINQKFEVLDTPWILSFIQFKGKMSPVPPQQIEGIRIMLEKPETLQVHDRHQLIGRSVRIVAGPLNGLTGKIKKLKNNTLVYMEINHLNKILSVEIDENDIIEYEGNEKSD